MVIYFCIIHKNVKSPGWGSFVEGAEVALVDEPMPPPFAVAVTGLGHHEPEDRLSVLDDLDGHDEVAALVDHHLFPGVDARKASGEKLDLLPGDDESDGGAGRRDPAAALHGDARDLADGPGKRESVGSIPVDTLDLGNLHENLLSVIVNFLFLLYHFILIMSILLLTLFCLGFSGLIPPVA